MPHFIWKGKNSYGEKRKGVIEAPNIDSAKAHLKKIRITPTKVKEKPKDVLENIDMTLLTQVVNEFKSQESEEYPFEKLEQVKRRKSLEL